MSIKQCERIGWPTIVGLGLAVGALARSFQYRYRLHSTGIFVNEFSS